LLVMIAHYSKTKQDVDVVTKSVKTGVRLSSGPPI
jgi:hypothetical protein